MILRPDLRNLGSTGIDREKIGVELRKHMEAQSSTSQLDISLRVRVTFKEGRLRDQHDPDLTIYTGVTDITTQT